MRVFLASLVAILVAITAGKQLKVVTKTAVEPKELSSDKSFYCEQGDFQCDLEETQFYLFVWCIDESWVCDNITDCDDGTDEQNCNDSPPASSGSGSGGSSPPASSSDGSCGVPAISPSLSKIVGGEEAIPNSWPWMVSLQRDGGWYTSHFCGGSIINSRYILTAAHCTAGSVASDFVVVAGGHSLDGSTQYKQTVSVARIIDHPNYNDNTMRFDASVLELSQDLNFNAGVSPICLPSGNYQAVGETAIVTGWGDTENTGDSNVLNQVDVPVVSNDVCNQSYGGITSDMICGGYAEGGKDSCQGDSGGPFVINLDGVYYQYGIVSFGAGCADPNYYGVYSRVTESIDWIHSVSSL